MDLDLLDLLLPRPAVLSLRLLDLRLPETGALSTLFSRDLLGTDPLLLLGLLPELGLVNLVLRSSASVGKVSRWWTGLLCGDGDNEGVESDFSLLAPDFLVLFLFLDEGDFDLFLLLFSGD